MNKFLKFIKKMFTKSQQSKDKTAVSEKASMLNEIKFDPVPVCIKKGKKVSREIFTKGNGSKYFITEDKIYNNGDVYSIAVGDGSENKSNPHFAFKESYQNYSKDLRKSVDFRYGNKDEYFSGRPNRIILSRNASEDEVKNWDEFLKGDMQLKEFDFKRQDDGTYIITRCDITSYLKLVSERGSIYLNGIARPGYGVIASVSQKELVGQIFTYEQIISLIDDMKMPHKLPDDFETIIKDGYKVPEGSDIEVEETHML